MAFLLPSCATEKVLYEKECKFVCINEFQTYEEIDNHACRCKPRDIKK